MVASLVADATRHDIHITSHKDFRMNANIRKNLTLASAISLSLVAQSATALDLRILPAAPQAQQPVRVTVAAGAVPAYDPLNMDVTMQNNKIIVTLKPGTVTAALDAVVGRLPIGNYAVELRHENTGELGQRQFNVAAAGTAQSPARPDRSGVWWNPALNGIGFFLQSDGDQVYGAKLAYGTDLSPEWLSLNSGYWIGHNAYLLNIDKINAPGALPARIPVGFATLVFEGHDRAQFRTLINGELTCTSLIRFSLSPESHQPLPECKF